MSNIKFSTHIHPLEVNNKNIETKHDQAWTNCARDADREHSCAQNLWDTSKFWGAQILPCKNEKSLDPQIMVE